MFTVQYRDQIHNSVLEMAAKDDRIKAGAVVGSLALEEGDRWSDLDLTFSVDDKFNMYTVLEDWTLIIADRLNAVKLFDLPSGTSIYRVFLLPGCLQFDLSFTPASSFGATGPKFKLLFGSAVIKSFPKSTPVDELFGYAVHHLLRARFCIERGRYWQSEYWISSARNFALNIACRQRGLPAANGRGYDQLPEEILDRYKCSLVSTLQNEDLLRALRCVIMGLLEEDGVNELIQNVHSQLQELMEDWDNK